jgi:sugar phosphate isomerase/epimerase
MLTQSRRTFLRHSTTLLAGACLASPVYACAPFNKRLFRMSLNPGAIGVKLDQKELLDAAHRYGFEAIVPFPDEVATWSPAQQDAFTQRMQSLNITWGAAGLPLDFRKSAEVYDQGMKNLPKLCEALQRMGVTRMNTWIMPTHQTLTYRENFQQHAERLGKVGKIIGDYSLRLGLEYVGPKTLMARDRFPFIHTLKELKELIEATRTTNVKVQLDSFHWFCAEETVEDLLTLSNDDIVTVDLNDATAGRTATEQIDGQRQLPGASGLIDLKAFLEALVKIGYDGPIRAEPFNKVLNEMDNEAALSATYTAMKNSFDLIK